MYGFIMLKILLKIYDFCFEVYKQFIRDGCAYRAAALAFTTLLSLVPLMAVSFAVLQAFPGFEGLGDKVQDLIFSNFVADSAQVVQQYIQQFSSQARHLSAAGLVSLLMTAVLMIFTMEQALNHIWRVKEKRRGVPAFLMYWAVLTLLPVIGGMGLILTAKLAHMPFIAGVRGFVIIKILSHLAPFIATFIAFTLLYISLPNCKVPMLAATFGGFVGALLFETAKQGFTLYMIYFPSYALLYGALAAIPVFLVWLYVSWLIILFGAVVGRVSINDRVGFFSSKGYEHMVREDK